MSCVWVIDFVCEFKYKSDPNNLFIMFVSMRGLLSLAWLAQHHPVLSQVHLFPSPSQKQWVSRDEQDPSLYLLWPVEIQCHNYKCTNYCTPFPSIKPAALIFLNAFLSSAVLPLFPSTLLLVSQQLLSNPTWPIIWTLECQPCIYHNFYAYKLVCAMQSMLYN